MFKRGLTSCSIILIGAMLCRVIGAESSEGLSVLESLKLAQKSNQDTGDQIILAMIRNNISSYELARQRFTNAHQPTIKGHHIETVYLGTCWSAEAPEVGSNSSVSSHFVERKIRLVAHFDMDEFETASEKGRALFLKRTRNKADKLIISRNPASINPNFRDMTSDAWICFDPTHADSLLSYRNERYQLGHGLLLEQLCVNSNGCLGNSKYLIKYGEAIKYCQYRPTANTTLTATPMPANPVKPQALPIMTAPTKRPSEAKPIKPALVFPQLPGQAPKKPKKLLR